MAEKKNFDSPLRYGGGGERHSIQAGYFPTWGLLARIVHSGALSKMIAFAKLEVFIYN